MRDEAALRAMFETFDADAKGYLDQSKFTALVRKLGLKLTDAKASNAFLALDAEGTGQVKFSEFSAWWFKYNRR